MRMSLKTSFLEHQAMNTYIMQSLQITCTGHKRKLRLARSHSAAQGRGPRVTLKGPLGTLPPNPPGPPGTKIPPVITLIGAIIWNRSGSFSMFFWHFSGRRDLLFGLGDRLFGLATAGGGRYVESLEPQVSTHTHTTQDCYPTLWEGV